MSKESSLLSLEKEIEQLEAEFYGAKEEAQDEAEVEEVVEEVEAEEVEATPEDPEEKTFAKRYADLRRHSAKRDKEFKDKEAALKAALEKVQDLEAKVSDPATLTKEEVLAWAEKNPQAAATIRALASEQVSKIAPRSDEVNAIREELNRTKELAAISKAFPDFEELTQSEGFLDWAESQTSHMQSFIFSTKSEDVIFAIKAYKEATKSPVKTSSDKAAASVVRKGGSAEPGNGGKRSFSESQVQSMSLQEYEANEAAIRESITSGSFVYDLSGGAR